MFPFDIILGLYIRARIAGLSGPEAFDLARALSIQGL